MKRSERGEDSGEKSVGDRQVRPRLTIRHPQRDPGPLLSHAAWREQAEEANERRQEARSQEQGVSWRSNFPILSSYFEQDQQGDQQGDNPVIHRPRPRYPIFSSFFEQDQQNEQHRLDHMVRLPGPEPMVAAQAVGPSPVMWRQFVLAEDYRAVVEERDALRRQLIAEKERADQGENDVRWWQGMMDRVQEDSARTEAARMQGVIEAERARAERAQEAHDALLSKVEASQKTMAAMDVMSERTEERRAAAIEQVNNLKQQLEEVTTQRDRWKFMAETYLGERDVARRAVTLPGASQLMMETLGVMKESARVGQEAAYYKGLYHQAVPVDQRRDGGMSRRVARPIRSVGVHLPRHRSGSKSSSSSEAGHAE